MIHGVLFNRGDGHSLTEALFAAGTYTTLDIYEKCRAR